MLRRHKIQIDSSLRDVLEPKKIKESKGVVVAGVQLVVGADAIGVRMRVARGVVVLSAKPRLPRNIAEQIGDLCDAGARMNRVVRVAASLQVSQDVVVKTFREITLRFSSERRLYLGAVGSLLALHTREGFDQNKWLEHGMWNPRTDGPIGAMKGQLCAMRVQRSGIDLNNRGAEDIDAVLGGRVTIMSKESIKGSTDIGPVADTNDTFIAELQLLSARVHPNVIVFVVVLQKALAQIEGVAHTRCDAAHGQP